MKKKVKILHTADWHLGLVSWRSRREVDRGEEQKEALEQLTEVAEKEKSRPDNPCWRPLS